MSSKNSTPPEKRTLTQIAADERRQYHEFLAVLLVDMGPKMHRAIHAPGALRMAFEEWASEYVELRAARLALETPPGTEGL